MFTTVGRHRKEPRHRKPRPARLNALSPLLLALAALPLFFYGVQR